MLKKAQINIFYEEEDPEKNPEKGGKKTETFNRYFNFPEYNLQRQKYENM